jgi:hypothetical protein
LIVHLGLRRYYVNQALWKTITVGSNHHASVISLILSLRIAGCAYKSVECFVNFIRFCIHLVYCQINFLRSEVARLYVQKETNSAFVKNFRYFICKTEKSSPNFPTVLTCVETPSHGYLVFSNPLRK